MRELVERITRPSYLIGFVLSAIPLLAFPGVYGGYGLPKAVALQLLTALILSVWAFRVPSSAGYRSESDRSLYRASGLEPIFDILRSPLTIAGLAFVVSQSLATIFSLSPSISFWGGHERWVGTVANMCGFVILLAVPLICRNRGDVRGMVSLVLLGSAIVAAIGIAQRTCPDFPIPAWFYPRVSSTLGNPIFLGAYLVLVVPLVAERWIESVRRLRAGPSRLDVLDMAAYTVLLAGQLACLFLTGSRGPWLGAACAALAFSVLLAWRRSRPRLLVVALTIFVGLALLLLLLNLPKTPLQALLDLPYVSRLRLVQDSGSVSERMLVWQGAWELIRERPAIGGAIGG
ncbi:MAG: O-antigen ligase family protein, partial [Anaerolineae bacterium]|nr:O-antigen ligase family protein [Anaerolineae bacterium]